LIPDEVIRARPSIRDRMEGPVIVGVRPEGFFLSPDGPPDQTVQVKADVVESLGNERMVYFSAPVRKATDTDTRDQRTEIEGITTDADTSILIARVAPYPRVEHGQTLRLGVNTRMLYFFDEEGNSLF
jgi:ABC-type sugar transport system ATPase subunit